MAYRCSACALPYPVKQPMKSWLPITCSSLQKVVPTGRDSSRGAPPNDDQSTACPVATNIARALAAKPLMTTKPARHDCQERAPSVDVSSPPLNYERAATLPSENGKVSASTRRVPSTR